MMINIDYIMNLFDWNNTNDEQIKGLNLAKDIKCISVFLQPGSPYGKNVWDNCAKVLVSKGDNDLKPYLIKLLEWLQDMNWPGAFCILERLQNYSDNHSFNVALDICLRRAKLVGDDAWENNLKLLHRGRLA